MEQAVELFAIVNFVVIGLSHIRREPTRPLGEILEELEPASGQPSYSPSISPA